MLDRVNMTKKRETWMALNHCMVAVAGRRAQTCLSCMFSACCFCLSA